MVVTKEWFRLEEAAEYRGVSKRAIHKLVRAGRLPAFRIGRQHQRRFHKENLDGVPTLLEAVPGADSIVALSAAKDPVLAEFWLNERDVAYDQL